MNPAHAAAVFYDNHTPSECWAAIRFYEGIPPEIAMWEVDKCSEFRSALRALVDRPIPGGAATMSIGGDSYAKTVIKVTAKMVTFTDGTSARLTKNGWRMTGQRYCYVRFGEAVEKMDPSF